MPMLELVGASTPKLAPMVPPMRLLLSGPPMRPVLELAALPMCPMQLVLLLAGKPVLKSRPMTPSLVPKLLLLMSVVLVRQGATEIANCTGCW